MLLYLSHIVRRLLILILLISLPTVLFLYELL